MPRSEKSIKQQYGYSREYQAKNIIQKKLIFNKTVPEDMRIMKWLDTIPESISPYLKRLILEDMARSKKESPPENP